MDFHHYTLEPRISETDALGHITNTAIPIWFEEARRPYFGAFGHSYDANSWRLILARNEYNYIEQIFLGESVVIKTTVETIGNSSFTLAHKAFQKDRLVADNKCVLVHFDFTSQRPMMIPDDVKKVLANHQINI